MALIPIIPFEPITADHIHQGEKWISQVKWDGVRVLTYFDGREARLFNRRKHERTCHYPELTAVRSFCKAKSVILDGEVIALGKDGKPCFHQVMRRDGIRRLARVEHVQGKVPVTYMIFDIVYYNGKWIDKWPLQERIDVLSHIIRPNDHIQIVPSHADGHALFAAVKEKDLEGIVVKDLSRTYLINGKDRRWQKKKHYKDLIAVVGGVTYRDGIVNAVLLGLPDDSGRLWYIGHVGTGKLTKEGWRELTERVAPLVSAERPFVNAPARREGAVWTKAVITVKVRYMAWTEGGTLRQPSIQAIMDEPPGSVHIIVR